MDGIILLLLFVAFLWYVAKQLKNDPSEAEIVTKKYPVWKMAVFIVGGLAAIS